MNRRDLLRAIGVFSTGLFLNNRANPTLLANNQVQPDDTTSQIFARLKSIIKKEKWQSLKIGDIIGKTGLFFVDTPYVGGTLDTTPKEQCVVDLSGMDCVTFFENSLCIARIIQKSKLYLNSLIEEVTFTRYRNGKIEDYSSRLHYTSDWITDNVQKKVIEDVTDSIARNIYPKGAKPVQFNVTFMSENPQYYKALQNDKTLVEKISHYESEIRKRTYFIITIDKIKSIEKFLKTGDIIAIATSKKGLDYSHTGLIFVDDEQIAHFLHASTKTKKVTLDIAISKYVEQNSSNIGISVLRPLEV